MTSRTEWAQLAMALRELHRTLMERARRDYEGEHGVALGPGELLQLLTTDEYFAWLRALSELMVEIDTVRESDPRVMEELSDAVRAAVEHFITPPHTADAPDAFAQRYWPAVQSDPHVAMAHAGVKKALALWPLPGTDAAQWLHQRHRITEEIRKLKRKD